MLVLIMYIWMDKVWWDRLTPTQKEKFQQPCIDIIDEREQNDGTDYRLLISVNACR